MLRVIDAEVGAVPEDRSVVHHPLGLEDSLPTLDLVTAHDRVSVLTSNRLRYGRRVLVGISRASTHHDEVENEDAEEDFR